MSDGTDIKPEGAPVARTLLDVEQYRAEVLELIDSPTPPEAIPLALAAGRVLASEVRARSSVPAFDNSAMDGYALRWEDLSPLKEVTLRLVGEVPAGSPEDPAVAAGEAVRIMTGAPLPSDADTIVPVEATTESDGRVVIAPQERQRGAHVRSAGDDLAADQAVASPGTLLTPRVLSAVAAAGADRVTVRRRPRVAVAATGDELVAPGGDLGRGQIYESNATHLAATAASLGAEVAVAGIIPDDDAAFVAALDSMSEDADLIVLSGGVSVGLYDVAREVLTARGGGTFRHVRMQPGKPQGWARWQGVPVIAFPGNPVSAAISFEVFGRPLLAALLAQDQPPSGLAVASVGWTSPSGRRQFLPVTLGSDANGRLLAAPAHRRGSASHMVTSLAGADALAEVPEQTTHVAPGDVLIVRSLS